MTSGKTLAPLVCFTVVCGLLGLVAHAIAYLTHEYSHSAMAWALGWMAGPADIDYGPPTLYNLVFLGEVDDNVAYGPIFASGHGGQAALIALAGVGIGNGLLYVLLYGLAGSRWLADRRLALSLTYWLALMCAGNVWSYVPVRAFATHADIALAARGLGLPTSVLGLCLLLPALGVVWHFFARMLPRCLPGMGIGSANARWILAVMTGFWFFSFFGGDGIGGHYGTLAQVISIVSRYLLFPLCVVWLIDRDPLARPASPSGRDAPGDVRSHHGRG